MKGDRMKGGKGRIESEEGREGRVGEERKEGRGRREAHVKVCPSN